MANGGVPETGGGLTQTSGENTRIAGVVGDVPTIPAQGVPRPQVSAPQPGPGDSPAEAAPTLEQWKAFQSSANQREEALRKQLAETASRATTLEQTSSQQLLQARVAAKAAEYYAWGATQPNVDLAQLEGWALAVAQEEVGQATQSEQDKKDAETYRQASKRTARQKELVSFGQDVMKQYGLTSEEFRQALAPIANKNTEDADFERQVFFLANAARTAKQSNQRFSAATEMVNATAFPGAGAATGADISLESPPPGVRRGTAAYGDWLARSRAAAQRDRG